MICEDREKHFWMMKMELQYFVVKGGIFLVMVSKFHMVLF